MDNEIQDLKKEIVENSPTSIMDKELSMYKVGTTFITCSEIPWSNGIPSDLIDMA